ncbi:MAG: helix-turn-helix domain-containing protein [Thermoproteota archaeon]|nr:helix-turn-helix transcriptional regulator [Candidatus Brockarchaeota archaeon]
METDKVISALNSKMRREILKTISKEPMTVMQVFEELKRRNFEVKYRETVYRALERLLDAGLVEKYYNPEKGLCYRIKVKLITLDLANDVIEIR